MCSKIKTKWHTKQEILTKDILRIWGSHNAFGYQKEMSWVTTTFPRLECTTGVPRFAQIICYFANVTDYFYLRKDNEEQGFREGVSINTVFVHWIHPVATIDTELGM